MADRRLASRLGQNARQIGLRHFLAKNDDALKMRIIGPGDITCGAPEPRIVDRLQLPPVRHDTKVIETLHQSQDLIGVRRLAAVSGNDLEQELMASLPTGIGKPDNLPLMIVD